MEYLGIVIVILLSFIVAVLATWILIPILKKSAGQNIREEGPEAHQAKAGTPSMGGIAIILAIVVGSFVGGYFGRDTLVILAALLFFGLIGFFDDYLKVIKKQNEGLKAWQKFGLQFIGAVALAVYAAHFIGTEVFIPFAGFYADFGFWYIPFVAFTILAMVNAVNLTDGLDGLAAGTTAIASAALVFMALAVGSDPSIGCMGAVVGACLGFLMFNKNPAKVFMGDTGSLALGGVITAAAIIMKLELLLPIIGLIYVLEVVSVCLQVAYFKATHGKRLFRMTPLHHHFELGGMSERKVVCMFWIITFICSVGGLCIVLI